MVLAERLASVGLLMLCWCCAGVFAAKVGDSCFLGDDLEGTCMTRRRCSHLNQLQARGERPPVCFFVRRQPVYCCENVKAHTNMPDGEWRWAKPKRRYKPWGRHRKPVTTTPTPMPTPTPTPTPTLPTPRAQKMRMSKSWEKCQEYAKAVYQEVELPVLLFEPEKVSKEADCVPAGQELIVGGVMAKPKEFPHMAALGYGRSPAELQWLCGGSLISERFVLTAAHCVQSTNSRSKVKLGWVRLGSLNPLEEDDDSFGVQTLKVVDTFKHPEYKSPSSYHDIALLKLASDVRFTAYARPACLLADVTTTPGNIATATGWGAIKSRAKETSKDLLKVDLRYLPGEKCNDTFGFLTRHVNSRFAHGFLDDAMICAGNTEKGRDTCKGDSGGPLQVHLQVPYCMYAVVGVVSFGSENCGNSPAVYTRVSAHLDWIEQVVWRD